MGNPKKIPTKEMIFFGKAIKTERDKRGWTQEELAKKAGITQQQIANYEKGVNEARLTQIIKICDALELSVDYMLNRDRHEDCRRDYDPLSVIDWLIAVRMGNVKRDVDESTMDGDKADDGLSENAVMSVISTDAYGYNRYVVTGTACEIELKHCRMKSFIDTLEGYVTFLCNTDIPQMEKIANMIKKEALYSMGSLFEIERNYDGTEDK